MYKYTIYICYVCYVEYMDRTCNEISYQINLFFCVYEYIYVLIFLSLTANEKETVRSKIAGMHLEVSSQLDDFLFNLLSHGKQL